MGAADHGARLGCSGVLRRPNGGAGQWPVRGASAASVWEDSLADSRNGSAETNPRRNTTPQSGRPDTSNSRLNGPDSCPDSPGRSRDPNQPGSHRRSPLASLELLVPAWCRPDGAASSRRGSLPRPWRRIRGPRHLPALLPIFRDFRLSPALLPLCSSLDRAHRGSPPLTIQTRRTACSRSWRFRFFRSGCSGARNLEPLEPRRTMPAHSGRRFNARSLLEHRRFPAGSLA